MGDIGLTPAVVRGALSNWWCPFAEGEALARSFNCKFIETSAKSRLNVEKAFYDIVREIRRYNREMQGYSTGSGSGGGMNGPPKQMDMDGGEQEAGCCSKCVIM